ncbi:hypothetical protein [Vibrio aestuarianus]|uniref:hypothetical protein n=1 Tax=Vibrio aestuarianus TaxID=28171 RepID=UPI0021C45A62|nr:hypothetical protein [Vibrio aestuarianus]MDE1211883.1 hypothetical protein [Vibrio aestuarianus]MDE1319830.1 hypothetical protein [Vibrio aestuarianus]CAH8188813.1 HTH cro/C1-type domain-containing protein [Vibrio aestuarianus]
MNLNQVTGAQLFDARTFTGMSISSAAKLAGLNRNVLSQFEKEKATLTSHEKKKLVSLYEERGYDFEQLESANEEVFEQNIADSKRDLEQAGPKEVSQRMIEFMDDVSDLLTFVQTPKSAEGLLFHAPVESNKDTLSLCEDYQHLNAIITEHLTSDKSGETKGKVGFFGENGEARAEKLIGLMALQYLRMVSASEPNLVKVSLSAIEDRDSDNYRVLTRLSEFFDYDSLELQSVSSKLVK